MIEQIARKLAEAAAADWGFAPETKDDWLASDECRETYRNLAQAILPLIEAAVLAERERCAGVAEQPIFFDYVRLTTPDGPFEPGSPYDRGRQVEAERIAKAIRSQP